jgi:type II secretory pathway pseudopilin PulG
MTTRQKAVITAVFTATVGAGIYGTRQAVNARAEVQTLREQQMALTEQIQQFQRERDETARLLAAFREDNQRLNQNSSELAKLRSEVMQLRNNPKDAAPISVQPEPVNPSIQTEAQSWLNRVNLLRQHLERMPELKVPELQFLREKDWLRAAEAGTWETEDDYRKTFKELRATAKVNFGAMIRSALIDFANANNEMFPSTISQLQPCFKTQVEEALYSGMS